MMIKVTNDYLFTCLEIDHDLKDKPFGLVFKKWTVCVIKHVNNVIFYVDWSSISSDYFRIIFTMCHQHKYRHGCINEAYVFTELFDFVFKIHYSQVALNLGFDIESYK